jgi:hypothetical protein
MASRPTIEERLAERADKSSFRERDGAHVYGETSRKGETAAPDDHERRYKPDPAPRRASQSGSGRGFCSDPRFCAVGCPRGAAGAREARRKGSRRQELPTAVRAHLTIRAGQRHSAEDGSPRHPGSPCLLRKIMVHATITNRRVLGSSFCLRIDGCHHS